MGRSIVKRLEQRWASREQHWGFEDLGYEPVVAEASVVISAPRQRVWDFVTAPESMFLMSDHVVRVFRVPGTPVGQAGEQICLVQEDSGITTVQLVEVSSTDAPRMLAARWLTSTGGLVERTVLAEADGGRTSLTLQLEMIVPAGDGHGVHPDLQAHVDSSTRRIRSALESGARFAWEAMPDADESADGSEGVEKGPA